VLRLSAIRPGFSKPKGTGDQQSPASGEYQAHGRGQFRLPFVEGPKMFCSQLQRCRHMQPTGFGRMPIGQVKRYEEAGIGVEVQNRSRPSATRSAPGRVRSPNIFRRRPAKSGHVRGLGDDLSGTMRAITRFRSRRSTVLPACSQRPACLATAGGGWSHA